MGRRRHARERALQALYQIDAVGGSSDEALALVEASEDEKVDQETLKYAKVLVRGVTDNIESIDSRIRVHSANWRLERMARVDRNVLRIATFELGHIQDVPRKVILNEAIEVAKRFGTEESGAFINGILDKIARDVRPHDGVEE